MKSAAIFETNNADRYLASLCQHFGRKIETKWDAGKGHVQFPFGQCSMTADDSRLAIVAMAKDQAHLDLVMQVVTSHLDRFAFRENPSLEWQSTEQNDSTEIATTGEQT